jgi:hypothetical protein
MMVSVLLAYELDRAVPIFKALPSAMQVISCKLPFLLRQVRGPIMVAAS